MTPRRALLLSLLSMVSALTCARTPSAPSLVTIVADPGQFGSIEGAAQAEARVDWGDAPSTDDDACTASFAATELARFLPVCLGLRRGSVQLATTVPARGHVVVVGRAGSSPVLDSLRLGTRSSAATTHGYRIRSIEDGTRQVVAIAGEDRAGMLQGAYALLEELGMRFYGLGDTGIVAPATPAPWPVRLSIESSPTFTGRGFWAWEPRGHREFFLWMARNRLNQWTAADRAFVPFLKKLGFQLTGGGHTIQSEFLPPASYYSSHPEWYGLQAGRRSPRIEGESGDNFCTSNRAARRELAENVTRALAEGELSQVDLLQLWMLDQGRWCSCRPCAAQGTPAERLLDVAADVAARVERSRRSGRLTRPIEISTLAYLETSSPPSRPGSRSSPRAEFTVTFFPYFRCYAHPLADSSCTEINRRHAASYLGWSRWAAATSQRLAVCEYYNVGAFKSLPLVFPAVMATDIAWYRDRSATSLSTMHAPTRAWGAWTLDHWLYARLAWNSRSPVDTLLDDFCRGYFPTTSALMREHYRHLETVTANILALQHCAGVYSGQERGGRLAQPALPLFPLRHLQAIETHPATDDAPDLDQIEAALQAADGALDQAIQGARATLEKARLAEESRRFDYGAAVFHLYVALIRTAERHRARDGDGARRAFPAAEDAARRLREVRDLVQVSASHANATDGLEASGVRATYEFFRALYGER